MLNKKIKKFTTISLIALSLGVSSASASTTAGISSEAEAYEAALSSSSLIELSAVSGRLLGGFTMPTESKTHYMLPNDYPGPVWIRLRKSISIGSKDGVDVSKCLLLGSADGVLSQRVLISLEKMICPQESGKSLVTNINGTVYGDDGKRGIKGILSSDKKSLEIVTGAGIDAVIMDPLLLAIDGKKLEQTKKPIKFSMEWLNSLNIEEKKAIDFNQVDFSEFIASLEKNIKYKSEIKTKQRKG